LFLASSKSGQHIPYKDFWGTYGQFIGLFAGGFVGAYAKVIFDKRKKKHDREH